MKRITYLFSLQQFHLFIRCSCKAFPAPPPHLLYTTLNSMDLEVTVQRWRPGHDPDPPPLPLCIRFDLTYPPTLPFLLLHPLALCPHRPTITDELVCIQVGCQHASKHRLKTSLGEKGDIWDWMEEMGG